MKYCTDCKYFSDFNHVHVCDHESNAPSITLKGWHNQRFAKSPNQMRNDETMCGRAARFFELFIRRST